MATTSTAMKQATGVPTRKVGASGIGGAVSVIVIYILQHYANIPIDAVLSAAITTVVTFAVGYFTPPASVDTPVPA